MKVWKPETPANIDMYTDWAVHATLVRRIVELLRPIVFVELGVNHGFSFFSIVESMMLGPTDEEVKKGNRILTAVGIDTWPKKSLYEAVGAHANKLQQEQEELDGLPFDIKLLRTTTEKAVKMSLLPLDNIDLLHIDASHRYEDVKRDWDLYQAQCTGIVLFHDSCSVMCPGVRRFLEELRLAGYAMIHFTDGEGLTVLFKDEVLYLLPEVVSAYEDWIINNRR